jgi:hypothetical protein
MQPPKSDTRTTNADCLRQRHSVIQLRPKYASVCSGGSFSCTWPWVTVACFRARRLRSIHSHTFNT